MRADRDSVLFGVKLLENNDIEFVGDMPDLTPEIEDLCLDDPASALGSSNGVKKSEEKVPWQKSLLLYLHDLVILLAVVVIVFLLLFRVVVVSGTSMNTTLLDGDYVLVQSNFTYKNVQTGDVVVMLVRSYDDQPIVKRVIATEGQVVDIDFISFLLGHLILFLHQHCHLFLQHLDSPQQFNYNLFVIHRNPP